MVKQQAQERKKEAEQQKPRKTFLFRLYPTHKQRDVLEEWLGLCCETYNAALDERKSAYRMAAFLSPTNSNAPNCLDARRFAQNWVQYVRKCFKTSSNAWTERLRISSDAWRTQRSQAIRAFDLVGVMTP